jgi:hypothetical protein
MNALLYASDTYNPTFHETMIILQGARGGVVVKTLRYKTGRLRVRFSMVSLEIFSDIILPVALWPWGRLGLLTDMSTRCISWW